MPENAAFEARLRQVRLNLDIVAKPLTDELDDLIVEATTDVAENPSTRLEDAV